MSKARHLFIEGRVQGVFFRESTRRQAQHLGLFGWVKNLPDGRVEAFAQGEPDAVDRFVGWCHEGPPTARVERVVVEDAEPRTTLDGFRVRY
jgi:acylphosphatase